MSSNYLLGDANSQGDLVSNDCIGALDLLTLSADTIDPPAPSVPRLPAAILIVLSLLLGITAMRAARRRL